MKILPLLVLMLMLLTGTARAEDIEIRFTYGSEKKEWVNAVVSAFNQAGYRTVSGKTIKIVAVPMGSGECISGILEGGDQAHLISPASDAFIKLGNARSLKATGKPLIGDTRNLVLSPVVIAMWEPMATALGWPEKEIGWHDVLKVSQNLKGWAEYGFPEWGHFKFGHTHPEFSNSGLISVIAEIYAATGKQRGLTAADLAAPETASFLSNVENAVVHYGESTGFFGSKMFERGPEYLSAAVLYENMVIESTAKKDSLPFPVVAIYPKEGTFWSDHPVAIVERPWVSAEHRRACETFITYMMAGPQQEKAMSFGFRPGNPAIKLTVPFDKEHGVDPLQPKTTLEVPSGELIEQSLALWKKCKKKANIVIVFDKSGSMKAEGRMTAAREGAVEMLKMLNDKDSVSILSFDDKLGWIVQNGAVATERAKLQQRVKALFPGGGTALYDATLAAHEFLQANKQPDSISAVVVLTDGEDTNSKTKYQDLLAKIKTDYETRDTRVFTIGYGAQAQKDKLTGISEATAAKNYVGDTKNIRQIFREISTFF
ncbi:MAG: hypothetical protein RL095_2203 [Verrucomicrobiota bacterium]|jgi:Ca-activated chloride channel family protein